MGNLSEFDNTEKVSDPDDHDGSEEYEVISAPVKRTNEIRSTNALSSAYKPGRQTDKMSIDSMTDLSPFDEGSSVKTSNTNKDDEEGFGKRKAAAQTRSSMKAQGANKAETAMPQ